MDNKVYQAPKAELEIESKDESQKFKYFNWRGRIGRLRYLQLAFFLPTVIFFGYFFLIVLLLEITNRNPLDDSASLDLFPIVILGLPTILVLAVLNGLWLSIQRSHDIGSNGWLALLAIIPLFGIALIAAPGDSEANNYGQKPKENSMLVTITGWLGLAGIACYYLLIGLLFNGLVSTL